MMAGRNVKNGLDYFPMDVTVFNDIKIRKLIKYQGGKAMTVYAYLLCCIYQEGYYIKWDDELPFIISEATGYDEAYIQEVLKCCFNVGILSKCMYETERIITSKGIQKRYANICKLLGRKSKVDEFSLINQEEIPITHQEMAINQEEIPITPGLMQQKKRKEKKEKEREEEELPPTNSGEVDLIIRKPVLECAKIYFTHHNYGHAIELLQMNLGLKSQNELKHLAVKFNEHCQMEGKIERSVQEWAKHFRFWAINPKRQKSEYESSATNTETPTERRQRLLIEQQKRNAAFGKNTTASG